MDETGLGRGRLCSLNVPFSQGLDDPTFHSLFKPVMTEVMQRYRPGAIVLQCGELLHADNLLLVSCCHDQAATAQARGTVLQCVEQPWGTPELFSS